MTILEIKKRLNDIKQQKEDWINKLSDVEVIQYAKPEDRELALDLKSDIKMIDILDVIESLNKEELSLKSALAKVNQNTLCYGELTLAETLVKMAQEQRVASRLRSVLPNDNKKLTMVGYGNQSYQERLYDIDEIRRMYNNKLDLISKLQLAIDVTNAKTEVSL